MEVKKENMMKNTKRQTSSIDGIPNIVLPNTLFNRITRDLQSDVIQRRQ